MPKQSPVEEEMVLHGLKYVRSIIKDVTRLCFDEQVTSKDVAKTINQDMRTNLSVPQIYSALRVMHRCNAYLDIVADMQHRDGRGSFPTSPTPVDYTIKEIARQWVGHIRAASRVEADWREADWNPVNLVHATVARVVDYNTQRFFGIRFENQSK